MYILKDQSLVLTSTWVEDITITLDFQICKTKLHERFSQHISISQQPFDQALVLKNKIFMFIDMNDDQKFYGKKTPDLTRIYTTLQHLIAQEKAYLRQIIHFNDMLTKADILTPVIPRRKRTVSRSSTENHTIITFQRFLSNSHENKRPLNLVKRSITDIFSPYSLTSIGDTANRNFLTMNHNFKEVQSNTLCLTHQQQMLAKNFNTMQNAEKSLARKELYIELRTFKENALQNFLFDLNEILKTIKLDPHFDIVFQLLREHEFCLNNVCYSLPIFTVLDAHQIQIQVQLSHQTLTKAHYVSCTILQNGRTSIFSHQIGIIDKNEELHFPENSLPSINLTDLLHPKIDQTTRKIGISDLILDQLYPIYAEKLISLQCLQPKFIFVDNKKKFCDATTLSFQKIPEIIQIDGQSLTPHIIPKRSVKN